jgi:hypothetical protein
MVPIGSSCFAASNRAPVPGASPEPELSVVWLVGEHVICDLNDLLGPDLEEEDNPAGKALGPWVAVPTAERRPRRPRPPEIAAASGRHLVSERGSAASGSPGYLSQQRH